MDERSLFHHKGNVFCIRRGLPHHLSAFPPLPHLAHPNSLESGPPELPTASRRLPASAVNSSTSFCPEASERSAHCVESIPDFLWAEDFPPLRRFVPLKSLSVTAVPPAPPFPLPCPVPRAQSRSRDALNCPNGLYFAWKHY